MGGMPVRDYLKIVAYKDRIVEFKDRLAEIGAPRGWGCGGSSQQVLK